MIIKLKVQTTVLTPVMDLVIVTDDVIAYSHSNEISEESLKKSSENLKSTLKSKSGTYNSSIKKTNQKFYKDIDPIETKSLDSKIELLNLMNDYSRSKDVFC